jgi:hypothetical protein
MTRLSARAPASWGVRWERGDHGWFGRTHARAGHVREKFKVVTR